MELHQIKNDIFLEMMSALALTLTACAHRKVHRLQSQEVV